MGLKLAERAVRSRSTKGRIPAPEDVFLAWLCWLPENTNIAEAAEREIQRLDSHDDSERPRQLKVLFVTLVENIGRGGAH